MAVPETLRIGPWWWASPETTRTDWSTAPGRQGPLADSHVEGGAGQQAGRVERGERGGVRCHQQRDLGAHQGDGVTAPSRQPLDDAHVLLERARCEHAVHQFLEDDLVDDPAVARLRYLGRDPTGLECPGIDRAVHQVPGAEHADARSAVAGGVVGDHLGDVQARKRELLSGLLEGHVGGVVRAGEEVRARPCEPLHAHGQGGPDRAVVSLVPRGHAARQGDAVQGHVRVVVGAQPAESLLAERSEAQRRAFRAVRENAKVPHAHRSRGPPPASASPSTSEGIDGLVDLSVLLENLEVADAQVIDLHLAEMELADVGPPDGQPADGDRAQRQQADRAADQGGETEGRGAQAEAPAALAPVAPVAVAPVAVAPVARARIAVLAGAGWWL